MALAPGCLWIPGLFPEKGKPSTAPVDDRLVSHCRPHSGRPLLLGEQTGEREIRCRIQGAEEAEWTLSFPSQAGTALNKGPAINAYPLAVGTESIVLRRDDLPWAPQPYEATLTLRLPADAQTFGWRIIVMPHADELWPVPETPESEG
ncbi:MAG: hypothetical protein KDA24_07515 [Deltaproteobacteria bacterium]|nr:hypothetical protein [Deltaproteobacteria bacterium]